MAPAESFVSESSPYKEHLLAITTTRSNLERCKHSKPNLDRYQRSHQAGLPISFPMPKMNGFQKRTVRSVKLYILSHPPIHLTTFKIPRSVKPQRSFPHSMNQSIHAPLFHPFHPIHPYTVPTSRMYVEHQQTPPQ